MIRSVISVPTGGAEWLFRNSRSPKSSNYASFFFTVTLREAAEGDEQLRGGAPYHIAEKTDN